MMTVIKTLRVMLIPNNQQATRLFQFAGSARFAFNWALALEKKNFDAGGKFISDYELRKMFTQFKNEPANVLTGLDLQNMTVFLQQGSIQIRE